MNRPATRIRIADNLDWIRTTGPDHIIAIATEQHQLEQRTPRAATPTPGPNTAPNERGYRIGHADPTAQTATTHTAPTPKTVELIDRNITAIHAQARNLDRLIATTLHTTPADITYEPDRYGLISNAIVYLPLGHQLDDAADQLHGHDLTRLDWLLQDLDDRTHLLVTRATDILDTNPTAAANPAVQRDLIGCKSHARFTALDGEPLWAMVDPRYRDLCTDCGQFRDKRKFPPDEPIIRAWDYGRQPSAADIERARRAAKIKPGRAKVA